MALKKSIGIGLTASYRYLKEWQNISIRWSSITESFLCLAGVLKLCECDNSAVGDCNAILF